MPGKPTILDQRHDDWPWPFSLIPRRWNAILSDVPPRTFGYAGDVPPPGRCVFAASRFGFMFSFQTRSHWLVRVGTFRYDMVDRYYTFPTFTLKKQVA